MSGYVQVSYSFNWSYTQNFDDPYYPPIPYYDLPFAGGGGQFPGFPGFPGFPAAAGLDSSSGMVTSGEASGRPGLAQDAVLGTAGGGGAAPGFAEPAQAEGQPDITTLSGDFQDGYSVG